MKKLFYFLLAIVGLFTASCKNSKVHQKTIVTGKVANASIYPNTKEFILTVNDITGDSTRYIGTIQKDGSFKIYFDQYIAQDVVLSPIVRTFIVHPGDSIHIDIDYKNIGNVVFSGDAEKTNNDLYHYINENYAVDDDRERNANSSQSFVKNKEIKGLIDLSKQTRDKMLAKREEFINKYNPNEEVKTWTKNYININYYKSAIGFVKRVNRDKPISIIKAYGLENISQDLDEIYNGTTLNTGVYDLNQMLFLQNNKKNVSATLDKSKIINDTLMKQIMVEKNIQNILNYNEIDAFNKNDSLIKQMLIGALFQRLLMSNDLYTFNKNKALFDKYLTRPFLKQPLVKYSSAINKNFYHPEIFSNATLAKAATTDIKGLIDSIREQNAGKVVLIDVWATTCGPCIGEFPRTAKYMQFYKGKDVKFVFICLESDKTIWKKYAENLSLGEHHYLTRTRTRSFMKSFGIQAIPYKILLNKKGVIVAARNQLRSVNEINRLLIDNPKI